MGEYHLRLGTIAGGGVKSLREIEGLSDRQVGLHAHERAARNRLFTDDDTATGGKAVVDATDSILRALDLDEEDELNLSTKSPVGGLI